MSRPRQVWLAVLLVELAVITMLSWRRWNTAAVPLPDLRQYHDSQTAEELQALLESPGPDEPARWRSLADACLAYGHYAQADTCLEQAWRLDPARDTAYQRGLCDSRLGRLDKARAWFEKVADDSGGVLSSRAWYQLGRLALRREDAAAATEAFRRAGDFYWPAVYQRAKLLVRGGQPAAAGPLLEQLLGPHRDDLRVWQLRGRYFEAVGELDQAERAFDRSLRGFVSLGLDDTELYLRPIRKKYGFVRDYGIAAEAQRKSSDGAPARVLVRRMLTDPLWQNAYLPVNQDLAELALRADDVESARRLIERQFNVQLYPSSKAWELRGDLAARTNDWQGAREGYLHALEISPANGGLETLLVETAEKLKQPRVAALGKQRSLLQAAMEMYRRNEIADAGGLFSQLLDDAPNWYQAWYYLGECHRLRGDQESAISAFEECLELNPDHGRARRALAQVVGNRSKAKP
jgi:tetratricopeptide (TPR) repeat protein